MCEACSPKCKTCEGINEDNCLTCDAGLFREKKNTSCSCFFDYIEKSNLCEACSAKCKTCSDTTETSCLTCYATKHREINDTSCICEDHYFEKNDLCEICHFSCLTCVDSEKFCTSCDSELKRTKNINSCPCIDGYA